MKGRRRPAIKLADRPTAAQCLRMIESEGFGRSRAANQQDVVGPGQRKGAGEVGEREGRLARFLRRWRRNVQRCRSFFSGGNSRQCLEYWRITGTGFQFSRRRLENLSRSQIELPHQEKIALAEPATETSRQISR